MPEINLGSNFQIDEDSNGDLVIRDTTSGIVAAKYDRSADAWTFNDGLTTDTLTTNTSLTDANSNTIADFAGSNLSVDGSNVLNASGDVSVTAISSNQNTTGSGIYLVDTSGGAVTLTLDTDDATGEAAIGVVNISGTNDVTVDTEGGETIDPGGASSKALSTSGWLVWFEGDGTNWDSSLAADVESITTGQIDIGSNVLAQSIVATGQVTLTSDTGVVDTGESATDATYRVALGVDDPNADVKLSATLFWDDSAGTYKVEITENVGGVNPTVNYDIIRTR